MKVISYSNNQSYRIIRDKNLFKLQRQTKLPWIHWKTVDYSSYIKDSWTHIGNMKDNIVPLIEKV